MSDWVFVFSITARTRRGHTRRAKAPRTLERVLGQTRRRSTERDNQTKRKSGVHSLPAADNQPAERGGWDEKLRWRLQRTANKITRFSCFHFVCLVDIVSHPVANSFTSMFHTPLNRTVSWRNTVESSSFTNIVKKKIESRSHDFVSI